MAAVLAKGGSARLGGACKPLVPWRGRPLVEHVLAAAAPCVTRSLVVTAAPEVFAHFAGRPGGPEVIGDAARDAGPLGGLLAALDHAGSDPVLLLGCDMPRLSTPVLRRIIHAAGDASATVPRIGGMPQPLCAVYGPGVRPVLAGLVGEPRAGLRALLDRLTVRWLDEAALGYHPGCGWFDDVDTWEAIGALPKGGPA